MARDGSQMADVAHGRQPAVAAVTASVMEGTPCDASWPPSADASAFDAGPDARAADPTRSTTRTESGQRRRAFLPHEDALIRTWRAGAMRTCTLLRTLRCGNTALYRRVVELGLCVSPSRRLPDPAAQSNSIGAAEGFRTRGAEGGWAEPGPAAHPIPASAGDPTAGGSGRARRRRAGDASLKLAPGGSEASAGGTFPQGSKGGRAKGGGAVRRVFTPAEQDVIRRCAAGEIGRDAACRELRTSYHTFAAALREMGLTIKVYRKTGLSALPAAPNEGQAPVSRWIPIAHRSDRRWRLYEGAPITIEAAREAVAAGRATMAQRRIDGGFDLLFRVVRR